MRAMRLCIIPKLGGTPQTAWYPWLCSELRRRDPCPFAPILTPSMPEENAPEIGAWVGGLAKALGPWEVTLGRTILVGHSVGCQAILRYLATRASDVTVAGVLCVAGWWALDTPTSALEPWVKTPFDYARARVAAGKISVLISDNDPHTTDSDENCRTWESRVGANVVVAPGAGHFDRQKEPRVLRTLLELREAVSV